MTEQEWLEALDPVAMIHAMVVFGWSDRKLRLFGCFCCKRIWHLFVEDRATNAVHVAELYADGLATKEDLKKAGNALTDVWTRPEHDAIRAAVDVVAPQSYYSATGPAVTAISVIAGRDYFQMRLSDEVEFATQCDILRCIFGNPFRPITLDPAWRTSTVVALTQGIYDDRAFERLPILADALQDAGCDNDDILNHCRGEGPHARGCWVVDLVLGKA